MPPRKLTADEQAFADHWSRRMFYFVKNMRRADLYIRTITREDWDAAYKEYANSGRVAGGEWGNLKRDSEGKKVNWKPKPEDREAYVDYLQRIIESHPLKSPINAAAVMFSGNGGMMCVQNVIVAEQPERVQKRFREEWNKLNNQDLEDTKEMRHGLKPFSLPSDPPSILPNKIPQRIHLGQTSTTPSASNVAVGDSDEDEADIPFSRPRAAPVSKIAPKDWKTFESIGQTYFSEDEEDETGFIAFELTGICIHKKRPVYKIRYEGSIDSIQLTEKELLSLVTEGVWI